MAPTTPIDPNAVPAGPPKRKAQRVPPAAWVPLSETLLVALAGLAGLIFHQVWLFPSLGPTAVLIAEAPEQESSRLYNTLVGHAIGAIGGLVGVWLFASAAPPVFASHTLAPERVWASLLAIALTALGGLWLKASHPPAAATTLLVSLGGFRPTLQDMLTIVAGVLIVALPGELLRRMRAGEAGPFGRAG